jgi:hypothetical protein
MGGVALIGVLAGLAGCGGSSSSGAAAAGNGNGSGTGALLAGGAASVYVVQNAASGTSSILQFTAGANGAMTPASTLNAPTGFSATAVAVDATGQIYVGGELSTQEEVLVYPAGSTGNAAPSRTILISGGAYYSFNPIESLSVDASLNLYVAGFSGTVTVYSASANGAATPARSLSGTLTTLANYYVYGVTTDTAGNVYVAAGGTGLSGGAILVFGSAANGNVAPARTITSSGSTFYGVAVDASGNVYAAEDNFSTGTTAAVIAEFSATASGAATPSKTITLTGTTPSIFGGLRIDSVGNIYAVLATQVGTGATATGAYSVVAMGPGATGSIAPAAQMTSAAWSSPGPQLAIR